MKQETIRYCVEYTAVVYGREVTKIQFLTMLKDSTPQDVANVVARSEGIDNLECEISEIRMSHLNGTTIIYIGRYIGYCVEQRRAGMMNKWLE